MGFLALVAFIILFVLFTGIVIKEKKKKVDDNRTVLRLQNGRIIRPEQVPIADGNLADGELADRNMVEGQQHE